jgi:hypothetical protein
MQNGPTSHSGTRDGDSEESRGLRVLGDLRPRGNDPGGTEKTDRQAPDPEEPPGRRQSCECLFGWRDIEWEFSVVPFRRILPVVANANACFVTNLLADEHHGGHHWRFAPDGQQRPSQPPLLGARQYGR